MLFCGSLAVNSPFDFHIQIQGEGRSPYCSPPISLHLAALITNLTTAINERSPPAVIRIGSPRYYFCDFSEGIRIAIRVYHIGGGCIVYILGFRSTVRTRAEENCIFNQWRNSPAGILKRQCHEMKCEFKIVCVIYIKGSQTEIRRILLHMERYWNKRLVQKSKSVYLKNKE